MEYKRIDLLVAAAERMSRRSVVAGEGPDRGRLERLAGAKPSSRGLFRRSRLARCLPTEANAHGRPVVCLRRGGAMETMINGETAEFFDRQDVDDVVRANQACDARLWDENRLKANANRFTPEAFRKGFGDSVAGVFGRGTR